MYWPFNLLASQVSTKGMSEYHAKVIEALSHLWNSSDPVKTSKMLNLVSQLKQDGKINTSLSVLLQFHF